MLFVFFLIFVLVSEFGGHRFFIDGDVDMTFEVFDGVQLTGDGIALENASGFCVFAFAERFLRQG